MSINQRQTPRTPATKFANQRMKMQKQMVRVTKPTGKKK